jgi:hypothetical protein
MYSIWPSIMALITVHWLKRQGLLRPRNAKVLAWEGVCFQLARWPWVLWAVIDAFRATIRKSQLTWRTGIGKRFLRAKKCKKELLKKLHFCKLCFSS